MSYDKTISADLYDQKWEDGTITITMKRGASVPVIIIKVTGAELTGSYTLSFIISTGTVIVFFIASFILYRIVRRDQDDDDGTETVPVKPVRRMEAEPA